MLDFLIKKPRIVSVKIDRDVPKESFYLYDLKPIECKYGLSDDRDGEPVLKFDKPRALIAKKYVDNNYNRRFEEPHVFADFHHPAREYPQFKYGKYLFGQMCFGSFSETATAIITSGRQKNIASFLNGYFSEYSDGGYTPVYQIADSEECPICKCFYSSDPDPVCEACEESLVGRDGFAIDWEDVKDKDIKRFAWSTKYFSPIYRGRIYNE